MKKRVSVIADQADVFARELAQRLPSDSRIEIVPAVVGALIEKPILRDHVLLDLLSARVPYLQSYVAGAALAGVRVENDPGSVRASNAYLALCHAARLGMDVSPVALLPQKEYGERVDPERDLGNLQYPLPWDKVTDYVGFPAVLRAVEPDGGSCYFPTSMQQLWDDFDRCGSRCMMVQHHHEGVPYIRWLCLGERVLGFEFDPRNEVYGERVVDDGAATARTRAHAGKLSAQLGLTINAVDVAMVSGRPVVVDAFNPCPNMKADRLGQPGFEAVIDALGAVIQQAVWA